MTENHMILYVFTDSLGGDIGLAISSAMLLSGMFQWGVRQSAELENQMTSVERVLEYSALEPEAPLESEGNYCAINGRTILAITDSISHLIG